MSNYLINHKNCPECGGRIKGYYYYCALLWESGCRKLEIYRHIPDDCRCYFSCYVFLNKNRENTFSRKLYSAIFLNNL